jgi:integrase
MKLKLDVKLVNALTLAKGRAEDFAWDTELKNFGLRLQRGADGIRRSYCVQYRHHGHTRRHTLGAADRLSLAQARAAARKALARVSLGGDPQGERDAKRAAAERTFAAAVEGYLAAKTHLRPGTLRLNRLYLKGAYFGPLKNVPLAEITRADLAARLTAIAQERGAGTAIAARRVACALLSWAVQEGWIENNPVVGTRKPPAPPSRDHVLTDAERAAVWRACEDDDYGCITRLLILLGARRQEVGGMAWSELDLWDGLSSMPSTWTLPAARSKNHRAHTVLLPAAALHIISGVPRTDRDHLFGEHSGAGFVTWSRHKQELDRRLGDEVRPWRLHDVRRTVATRMGDLGVQPHVIEQILNHQSGHRRGPAGTYNRSAYDREVRSALERWASRVEALVSGKPDSVVALQRPA